MAARKGHAKLGGRQKGTPNRTTKQARELLEKVLFGEIDNIHASLTSIRKESEDKYVDSLVKLFKYVLPQKTDVTTDGKEFPRLPDIIIK